MAVPDRWPSSREGHRTRLTGLAHRTLSWRCLALARPATPKSAPAGARFPPSGADVRRKSRLVAQPGSHADVAQQARASPCQGEGRGFESRCPLREGSAGRGRSLTGGRGRCAAARERDPDPVVPAEPGDVHALVQVLAESPVIAVLQRGARAEDGPGRGGDPGCRSGGVRGRNC